MNWYEILTMKDEHLLDSKLMTCKGYSIMGLKSIFQDNDFDQAQRSGKWESAAQQIFSLKTKQKEAQLGT